MTKIKVGATVTYVPGESDHAARPKKTAMPAVVTSVGEKEVDGEKVAVYNLNVHQDTDSGLARRLKVKHAYDALEGESFITEGEVKQDKKKAAKK
jgi:hypothetical protein